MAQMMYSMSLKATVFTLMADAGMIDTVENLAAIHGIDKKSLQRDPYTNAPKLVELLGERSIVHVNPENQDATLANFFGWIADITPPDQTPVCFVDSAQVIRHGADIDRNDDRTRPEIVGAMCRVFATRYNAVVVLSTKANRAYYRNRDKKDNSTAISSAMGGDYEYTADAFIVLSRPDK